MKKVIFFVLISSFILAGCTKIESNISANNLSNSQDTSQEKNSNDKTDEIWSNVKIVTENYPPLNYLDEETGEVMGDSTVLVKQAMKSLGINLPIHVYPWARSYQIALGEENVLIYSITRTKEREKMFKWVAPLVVKRVWLYALKDRNIKINSLEDIGNYKISTMKEDFTEQGLKEMGYGQNILSSPNQTVSATQLFEKRTDLWIATAEGDALEKICDEAGYDVNKLEAVFEIDELKDEEYIAASLKTSDEIVEKFREAMPKIDIN